MNPKGVSKGNVNLEHLHPYPLFTTSKDLSFFSNGPIKFLATKCLYTNVLIWFSIVHHYLCQC
jgi:hypothetical protein